MAWSSAPDDITGPTLILGLALLCGSIFVLDCAENWSEECGPAYFSALLSFPLMMLSLLPSDRRCIIVVCVMLQIPVCSLFALTYFDFGVRSWELSRASEPESCTIYGQLLPCWYVSCEAIRDFVIAATFSATAVRLLWVLLRRRRNILFLMWWYLGVIYCIVGSMCVVFASAMIVLTVQEFFLNVAYWQLLHGVETTLISIIAMREQFIRKVQSWLLSRGEAATTAAGKSYLLSGRNIEEVLAMARRSFFV